MCGTRFQWIFLSFDNTLGKNTRRPGLRAGIAASIRRTSEVTFMISLSLTNTAEYALRAMSHLALSPKGVPVRANELAQATAVPLPYLAKIMRRMVDANLVVSAKGHGGGFHLSRPLSQISYLEILEAAGYGSVPDQCVFGWGQCHNENPCPMHESWSVLNGNFKQWAKTTTLASVLRNSRLREGKGPSIS